MSGKPKAPRGPSPFASRPPGDSWAAANCASSLTGQRTSPTGPPPPTDRGRGYATRSVTLLLNYARSIGIRHAEAHIAADNYRSRRVAEKARFLPTDTYTEQDGTDMIRYQIHLAYPEGVLSTNRGRSVRGKWSQALR